MHIEQKMNIWLTVYCTVLYLSFLHVSTPTLHPQGAVTWYLLSYINVFMQSGWCLLFIFTFVF